MTNITYSVNYGASIEKTPIATFNIKAKVDMTLVKNLAKNAAAIQEKHKDAHKRNTSLDSCNPMSHVLARMG